MNKDNLKRANFLDKEITKLEQQIELVKKHVNFGTEAVELPSANCSVGILAGAGGASVIASHDPELIVEVRDLVLKRNTEKLEVYKDEYAEL